MRDARKVMYSLLPERYTDVLEREARYARIEGYRDVTSSMIMTWFVLSLFVFLTEWSIALRGGAFLVIAPLGLMLPYIIFSVLADRRRKSIERVLPDALLLMSANIESGLTVDKAFLLSARDEFGPLADDIQRTAMKMFGGTPVEEALEQLAESTNSELFAETLKLLNDGISAGGEVSKLLESSANDIRNSLHLREEIAANVKMYSLFILIASIIGAPVLFGVSTYLTETTASLWGNVGTSLSDIPSQGPLSFSPPSFNVDFFRTFAVASLIISNTFAALIISEIKEGSMKSGFKFVPVFVILSVLIYFVVTIVIRNTFGIMV